MREEGRRRRRERGEGRGEREGREEERERGGKRRERGGGRGEREGRGRKRDESSHRKLPIYFCVCVDLSDYGVNLSILRKGMGKREEERKRRGSESYLLLCTYTSTIAPLKSIPEKTVRTLLSFILCCRCFMASGDFFVSRNLLDFIRFRLVLSSSSVSRSWPSCMLMRERNSPFLRLSTLL